MVLETFIAYNRFNEPIEFKLVKVGEDCFRIWRNQIFLHERKTREEANKKFSELKKEFGVYE